MVSPQPSSRAAANSGVRYPRYAIVKLGTEPNVSDLFIKLQELGYFEVSFVHELRDSPYYNSTVTEPSTTVVPLKKIQRKRKKNTVDTVDESESSRPRPSTSPLDNTHSESSTSYSEEVKAVPILRNTDPTPTATIEIRETVPLTGLIIDADIKREEKEQEGGESADGDVFQDGSAEAVALAQLFAKETSSHGFARERDYKYKLESGIQNCEECGRQFVQSQFKNILAHAKSHYQMKPWACPLCDEQSVEAEVMREHIREEHADSEEHPVSNGVACERLRSEWAGVARRCFPKLEDRIDKWESNVKKIYATAKPGDKVDGLSVIEQLSQRVRAEQVINGGKWVGNLHIPCKLCGKVLACRDVSILVRHTKTHYPVKQFACSLCDYTNAERRNMRQHMDGTHPGNTNKYLDRRNMDMEDAWMGVGRECFPDMSVRLDEAIQSYKPKMKKEDAPEGASPTHSLD